MATPEDFWTSVRRTAELTAGSAGVFAVGLASNVSEITFLGFVGFCSGAVSVLEPALNYLDGRFDSIEGPTDPFLDGLSAVNTVDDILH
jgi:hypothetical protein